MHTLPTLPEQTYPVVHRHATRQLLMDTASQRRKTPKRPRALIAAGTGVLTLGSGGAIAYALIGSAPITDKHAARCYSTISTNFGDDFPGVSINATRGGASPSSPALAPGQVSTPLQMCAYLWSIGAVPSTIATGATPRSVPHLVACVLPDGTAAVFPGPDGTCEQVGLPPAQ